MVGAVLPDDITDKDPEDMCRFLCGRLVVIDFATWDHWEKQRVSVWHSVGKRLPDDVYIKKEQDLEG